MGLNVSFAVNAGISYFVCLLLLLLLFLLLLFFWVWERAGGRLKEFRL